MLPSAKRWVKKASTVSLAAVIAVAAAEAARAKGMTTIAMTGQHGGALAQLCDIAVKAPRTETYQIQELQLPIYHTLCAEAEAQIFGG